MYTRFMVLGFRVHQRMVIRITVRIAIIVVIVMVPIIVIRRVRMIRIIVVDGWGDGSMHVWMQGWL